MRALDNAMQLGDNKGYERVQTGCRGGGSYGKGGNIMRVIAGEARGRRLEALPGTDVTRPTLRR